MHENDILRQNLKNHPLMQVQDAVKLIYQSTFGGGHLIKDEYNCYERIENEGSSLTTDQLLEPYYEDIGGGWSRMNLSVLKVLPYRLAGRIFFESNREIKGSEEEFERKIKLLRALCEAGDAPFNSVALDKYMAQYRADGIKPVHHSPEYVENYHPAYRVVRSDYCRYLDVFIRIARLLSGGGEVTVAIDGQAASGKTTLAKLIATVMDCNVFHCDDFFLPPELKTPDRLREIGGNMDYIRFKNEIMKKLNTGMPFSYGIYDCTKQKIANRKAVPPKPLNIVEGAYCLHPTLQKYYELKIFMGIDPVKQSERILRRNGETALRRFQNEWIPKENEYIEKLHIKLKCDLVYINGRPEDEL